MLDNGFEILKRCLTGKMLKWKDRYWGFLSLSTVVKVSVGAAAGYIGTVAVRNYTTSSPENGEKIVE